MSDHETLIASLDAAALAAIEAAGALFEMVSNGAVPHPQEFGMEGCPACKARDLVADAADELTAAREALALWQPGRGAG